MKKKESKKFEFEKFQLVKLNNLRMIVGGGDTGDVIDTGTNTGNDSSNRCQNQGNQPRNVGQQPINVPKKD